MITRDQVTAWTTALRSGNYEQHRESLANEDKTAFCCLGLLCDINGMPFDAEDAAISKPLGVVSEPPYASRVTKTTTFFVHLATLNDIHLADFNKIADAIDEGVADGSLPVDW